jgi:SAM-dependent methyltransferase
MGVLARLFGARPAHQTEPVQAPTPPASPSAPQPASLASTFARVPGEDAMATMTPDELFAWENRDVPSLRRETDTVEARADEKQDATTSLNFPLHWTSPEQSWRYLFDFSVACDLLGPRPDDLVLDFAAGTCWATELLNRLGVRTVSIDLSVEMMRRGRQRLASDSRLVFKHDATFVASRGQSLPFADEVFEGVLCMNALHHLPSYAVALREIYRVLKPGGRAVFSEPGSSHATEPLSQYRMREENVVEKNVSLAAVRRLAMDAGFSRMRVVPLRSSDAYAFDYQAASDDAAALERMWEETLRHGAGEHARFVLHKGEDPPADTLLPGQKLIGRLKADIVLERVSDEVRKGQVFTDRVRVTNTGSVTWKMVGRRFGGQVTVGLKVCDGNNEVLREDLARTPLPRDIAPGESMTIDLHVPGVLDPGRYTLRYDMVVEGVTWFEFQGSTFTTRELDVSR